jgi:hypothetical protein
MSAPDWSFLLQQAVDCARQTLADSKFDSLRNRLPGGLRDAAGCREALEQVTFAPSSTSALERQRPAGDADAFLFEQWLLLHASLDAAGRIASWRVDDSVRRLWIEEMRFYARPEAAQQPLLALQGVRFREMARIATLRRYPAGQFHWELSGLPRSYLPRTRVKQWPALVRCLASIGGFAPMAETHLNDRRKNRLTLSESEGALSYYRLARSLRFHPEMRGLFTSSWLYCRTTGLVTPRLAWMRGIFEDNGAFLGDIGAAPPESGFLTGSEERRSLFEQGSYRPRMVYVLWPRRQMLAWAQRHPEYAGEA